MDKGNIPAEIRFVADSIAERFGPEKIYLFSNKRGAMGRTAGFKLCLVMDCADRGESERQIYLETDSEVPFDIVLYSPEEWDELCARKGSFAQKVAETGALIHG